MASTLQSGFSLESTRSTERWWMGWSTDFRSSTTFGPHVKRTEQLKTLKAWHQEQVSKFAANPDLRYCPEDELITYCRQDVRLLREGFEKYRQSSWTSDEPGPRRRTSTLKLWQRTQSPRMAPTPTIRSTNVNSRPKSRHQEL